MSTPRTAIYLRVSTEEQRERQSIATQRDFAERYCALHDIPIYGWYADDGVSGTVELKHRPEGARLLHDAQEGRLDTILVYRLDRLGRDPRLTLNAVNELENMGVRVLSMTEAFDTDTPAGRLMLTMLSGMAGFERDSIIQRSVEGTNRLAREGTWLGGIVPYGYQVSGKNKDARLVISEQRIEGCGVSEADVIRLIYHLTVEDDQSCIAIATHLNALGVPPAYVRDGREVLRGKRTQATQGIWRAGRIRNMIVNTTYKGIHQYGVRARKQREVIEREVPAIVSVDIWQQAQERLRAHMVFSRKNAKHQYLLRGLIVCGMCGLNYCGIAYHDHPTHGEMAYYKCNGASQHRGIYGAQGQKCPSKAIQGPALEARVWADVEEFLHNPQGVLDRLAERLSEQDTQTGQLHDRLASLQQAAQSKQGEKDAVIALFRRGRIDAAALDRQLDQIQSEETTLREQIERLQEQMRNTHAAGDQVRDAETLLRQLSTRLAEPLTWELQRQLVEALVERIQVVTTLDEHGKKHAKVYVTYRFDKSPNTTVAIRTGRDSWPRLA